MTRQDSAVHWRLICVLSRVWIESLNGQIGTLYVQFTILPYLHVYSQAKINNLSQFPLICMEQNKMDLKKTFCVLVSYMYLNYSEAFEYQECFNKWDNFFHFLVWISENFQLSECV